MRRRPHDEHGLALVLTALLLVVIMIFAAFAVDLGMLFNERRQDQTGADAAALAGAGMLGGGQDAAAQKIIDVSYQNLDTGGTLAQWTARWAACSDPGRDASEYPVVSTQSPCISFNPYLTRVRVRIPDMPVDMAFSKAAGFDRFISTAVAEAELIYGFASGILPFGLPGGSANQSEVCLKSGPDGHAPVMPPCDGSTTGNFGSLDISWYGNPTLGTPTQCTGNENGRLAGNMALGVDHPLDELSGPDESPPETGEAVRNDRSLCPDQGARPNQILGQTGIGSGLDPGMVSGVNVDGRSVPGRLTRTSFATRAVRSGTPAIEDKPLWEFIDPGLTTGIPTSCVRSNIASKAQMKTCIADYVSGVECGTAPSPCTTPLFTADTDGDAMNGVVDIQRSSRFAFVPELWELVWGPGSGDYTIKRFRPVFVQTTFFGCDSSSCDGLHDPGETGSGLPVPHNRKLAALTGLLLVKEMLPPHVIAQGPGASGTPSIVLRK
jgi:hypothetical protein